MPGTTDADHAEATRLVLGELPDLPARAGGARPRRHGRDDRPRARGRGRPRRRPAARRLAAHRRQRGRPPARAVAARPGPRHGRGAGAGLPGRVQDPGRRPVDAGRHGREAARRQGARRPRRPPRARAGARRGRPHPPRRPASAAPRCRPLDRAGRRAGAGRGRGRPGADRQRLRPAPQRRPARGVGAPGVGRRRDRRRGRRGVGALLRPADPVVARRRDGGAGPVRRPRHARAGRPRHLRGGAGVRPHRRPRRRTVHRPGRPRSPRCAPPSGSSAGSTCSAWTPTAWAEHLVVTPTCGLAGASAEWAGRGRPGSRRPWPGNL